MSKLYTAKTQFWIEAKVKTLTSQYLCTYNFSNGNEIDWAHPFSMEELDKKVSAEVFGGTFVVSVDDDEGDHDDYEVIMTDSPVVRCNVDIEGEDYNASWRYKKEIDLEFPDFLQKTWG